MILGKITQIKILPNITVKTTCAANTDEGWVEFAILENNEREITLLNGNIIKNEVNLVGAPVIKYEKYRIYCEFDLYNKITGLIIASYRLPKFDKGYCQQCGDNGESRNFVWFCRNGHGKIF